MARGLVPYYGEIIRSGRGIGYPFRRAHNRFERYARFIYKQAEHGFAVSHATKVARVADEYSSHSPQTFKSGPRRGTPYGRTNQYGDTTLVQNPRQIQPLYRTVEYGTVFHVSNTIFPTAPGASF